MYKYRTFGIRNLIVGLFFLYSAPSEGTSIREKVDQGVCGFKFSPVENLIVTTHPIRRGDLRSRLDNERYDACPYIVTVKYHQISFKLDFGKDINLEHIRDVDEFGVARTAFFRHDENGWASAGEDVKIKTEEISIIETPGSMTVSGVLTRKNQQSRKEDFCFSVVVIGKKKYATGAICVAEITRLGEIRDIFAKKAILISNQ